MNNTIKCVSFLVALLLCQAASAQGLVYTYSAQIESVKLIEDATAFETRVEVKVDQSLHHANIDCPVSETEKTLQFVYDDLMTTNDDKSAALFMYSLLLTAKSTGVGVDIGYRSSCPFGPCMDYCVIDSVRAHKS